MTWRAPSISPYSGVAYASYSGQPSTYFVRSPPSGVSPPPPFESIAPGAVRTDGQCSPRHQMHAPPVNLHALDLRCLSHMTSCDVTDTICQANAPHVILTMLDPRLLD